MKSKQGAECALKAAEEIAAAAPAPQTVEEATSSTLERNQLLLRRGSVPSWLQWSSIKSKARAAGAYAVLRTRQGISMLGEPELGIGVIVKENAKDDESQ
ncbi:hypothetical protein ACP70R_013009 [Stipagrostis hirtigluma subsp. patula]